MVEGRNSIFSWQIIYLFIFVKYLWEVYQTLSYELSIVIRGKFVSHPNSYNPKDVTIKQYWGNLLLSSGLKFWDIIYYAVAFLFDHLTLIKIGILILDFIEKLLIRCLIFTVDNMNFYEKKELHRHLTNIKCFICFLFI